MAKRTQRKTKQMKTQRKTQRKTKQRKTQRKTKQRKTQRKKTYKLKGGTFTYDPLNCNKSKCKIILTLTTLTIKYDNVLKLSKTFNLPILITETNPEKIKFRDRAVGNPNIYTLTPHSADNNNEQYNKLQNSL